MSAPIIFAGPTLSRALKIDPELPISGLDVRTPIKRDQLPPLVGQHAPGILVIVDGLFHGEVAVGHREIRLALQRGWVVWGLSSMGAIRAFEMGALGMRGYGRVYDLFCQPGVDFRDDEVTLMHEAGPEYRELSEPLVHIRVAGEALVAAGILTAAQRAELIGDLEGIWYADRTMAWLGARLRKVAPDREGEITAFLADFDRHRIKSHDLIAFLRSGLLGS